MNDALYLTPRPLIPTLLPQQEAFTSAKLAFASYKARVRTNLVTSHMGPETLDEAVQDYINRNTDLYDLPGLVNVSRRRRHCNLLSRNKLLRTH